MEILKPPTNSNYKIVYVLVCSNCGATLKYSVDDVVDNHVCCPCCNTVIITSANNQEEPEPPRFVWPSSFYHFGESARAAKIPDNEVQQMVDRMVKKFPELKPGEFDMEATGDTMVLALKYKDSNEIVVAKNYWEDEMIKEE